MNRQPVYISDIVNVPEHPILFSGPLVRAIRDGLKTQTRRPVKPQPIWITDGQFIEWLKCCPYGKPGDRLWVRETFTTETNYNLDPCDPPFNDGRPVKWTEDADMGRWWEQPHYRATDPAPDLFHEDDCKQCDDNGYCNKWKPSIHMPRWASRITLEITKVRVERLQAINELECQQEGIWLESDDEDLSNTLEVFQDSWDSIYAARGFGWDANPWVWVVEFKRIQNGGAR